MPPPNVQEGEKPVENHLELVFFVEEHESFKLEDLLEATTDLRNQSFSSAFIRLHRSFGVILLELLTGKTVEGTGIDLPKWVTAMVKEQWTGEVFDKEVAKAAKEWAFPLLNVALKCVSASPTNRPTVEEVYEKIEEVIHDTPNSSDSTTECGGYQDNYCMLHSIIPETWDTPGSNY
nr:probable inactive receptor kinase At2g26730 [Malus domestica]